MSFWKNYEKRNPIINIERENEYIIEYEYDYNVIYDFLISHYPIIYTKEYIKNFIQVDKNFFLKLVLNFEIIGIISAEYIKLNIGDSYIINHLCIKNKQRNKNLCTYLIEEVSKKIYNNNIHFAIFSIENKNLNIKLNRYIRPISIKNNYVCFSKDVKKKKYVMDLYDYSKITKEHKTVIYNKYLEKYQNYDIFYQFNDYEDFFNYFNKNLLFYDKDFNFVFLKENYIEKFKRYFISCYYINKNDKTFVNKLMNTINCDILHLNDIHSNIKNLKKIDSQMCYYLYNYDISKNDIKDNIFIT